MYTNTSSATMNRAAIRLDFFEPINAFIKEPETKESDSEKKDSCHYFIVMFGELIPILDPMLKRKG